MTFLRMLLLTTVDCGTLRGIEVSALKKNEEIVESLGERILGRVALTGCYQSTYKRSYCSRR